jgi:hypothetical protein
MEPLLTLTGTTEQQRLLVQAYRHQVWSNAVMHIAWAAFFSVCAWSTCAA